MCPCSVCKIPGAYSKGRAIVRICITQLHGHQKLEILGDFPEIRVYAVSFSIDLTQMSRSHEANPYHMCPSRKVHKDYMKIANIGTALLTSCNGKGKQICIIDPVL
ncbi:hypothetical protein PoB_000035600 [Plakobranchus ocellatus]|uniref:Uncharacterized protein n=1 Tax=Plakobranchus ocellatus TaxID=259542 RepID=A0AAV3WT29_9GAST|nr:hypothetical protein PoB_000035600 [Plakobranchus ocellatus]